MTLIEAVVWVAVLSFAMLALTTSLLYFYRTNRYVVQEGYTVSTAQHAMDIMVGQLRTAAFSNNGAYPIVSIAPNQIVFYANVAPNDPLIQEVRMFVSGNSIEEGLTEPAGDPLTYSTSTEQVTDLGDYVLNGTLATSTFYYYDQNGSRITDYSQSQNVRFVTINLIVDVSTSSLPSQLTLISSAALRNLINLNI